MCVQEKSAIRVTVSSNPEFTPCLRASVVGVVLGWKCTQRRVTAVTSLEQR